MRTVKFTHTVFAVMVGRACFKHGKCPNCWRWCPGECLDRHLEHCNGACKKCPECKETFYDAAVIPKHREAMTYEQHQSRCGQRHRYCANCQTFLPRQHRCTITKTDLNHTAASNQRSLWVFDIESLCEPNGRQVPDVIVARLVPRSLDHEEQADYLQRLMETKNDGESEICFTRADVTEQDDGVLDVFCKWLQRQKRSDFIAHNMRAYDGVMVHSHLRYQLKMNTRPIFAGLKVMSCKFGTNRLIDSLNHIQSALKKLPKILGVTGVPGLRMEKDYFPYRFFTPENKDYVGPIPDLAYFEPQRMDASERAALEAWHAEFTGDWDMQAVTRSYCQQDVWLLAVCIGEYRRQQVNLNSLDPVKYSTIAGYCLAVYRNNHIPPEGITTLTEAEATFARRAFHGGRTEVFKSRAGFGQQPLQYMDVVSLYPTVQFYDDLPVGVPTIYDTARGDVIPDDYLTGCGFAEVDFTPPPFMRGPDGEPLPPEDYIPVLSGQREGKLAFTAEPQMRQVVALVELRQAVARGYTVDHVYQVHLYAASNQLFKSYVSHFYKIKAEASGYASEAEVERVHADTLQRLDINLDKAAMRQPENTGRRSLAKMALNNLWGRLAMRDYPSQQVCDVKQYNDLMSRVSRNDVELVKLSIDTRLPDRVVVDFHERKERSLQARHKTNVALGATITAQARLRLYEQLGHPELAGRVCYCDTDSIIYIYGSDDDYQIPQGRCLGQWEDESKRYTFNDFVGVAPKTYMIRHLDAAGRAHDDRGKPYEQKLKVKGFQGGPALQSAFTFDNMVGLATDPTASQTIEQMQIVTKNTPAGHEKFYTILQKTQTHPRTFKRQPSSNRDRPYSTLPFGNFDALQPPPVTATSTALAVETAAGDTQSLGSDGDEDEDIATP